MEGGQDEKSPVILSADLANVLTNLIYYCDHHHHHHHHHDYGNNKDAVVVKICRLVNGSSWWWRRRTAAKKRHCKKYATPSQQALLRDCTPTSYRGHARVAGCLHFAQQRGPFATLPPPRGKNVFCIDKAADLVTGPFTAHHPPHTVSLLNLQVLKAEMLYFTAVLQSYFAVWLFGLFFALQLLE
jgi:hypothetical protein